MIKIICVGKLKEKYWQEAVYEYQKRLGKYTRIKIIEITDSNYENIEKILEEEKSKIEKQIAEKDYLITLEIEGEQLTSIDFSKQIEQLQQHFSTITFIIGGSHGLHKELKERSNFSLSFSKFTFPHQLFRVILLEQIYRSYRILNHESYHK